jgi:hypothetical protein
MRSSRSCLLTPQKGVVALVVTPAVSGRGGRPAGGGPQQRGRQGGRAAAPAPAQAPDGGGPGAEGEAVADGDEAAAPAPGAAILLAGQPYIQDHLLGRTFRISAQSFFREQRAHGDTTHALALVWLPRLC